MNIVAISSLGAEHRYALTQLHAQFPIQAILQPTLPPAPVIANRWSKLKRMALHPLRLISERCNNWWRQTRDSRLEAALYAELFPAEASPDRKQSSSTQTIPEDRSLEQVPRLSIRRDQLHTAETIAWLESHRPDLIITAGCPILKRKLFELPRLGTLNLHWGIAPAYRGEDTLFWPLYLRDYAQLGFTIHQINASIDGGRILSQGHVEHLPGDTETSITIRAARLAGEQLPLVVDQVNSQQQIAGVIPKHPGRLFLRRDRRWWHDLQFALQHALRHDSQPHPTKYPQSTPKLR